MVDDDLQVEKDDLQAMEDDLKVAEDGQKVMEPRGGRRRPGEPRANQ